MNPVFVDSSGFYAALDASDPNFKGARRLFDQAERAGWNLVTHSYIVQETWSLVQARLGWEAVDKWLRVLLPRCEVVWVDEALHVLGAARCRQARSRRLSLTDCVSLELMQRTAVGSALAYDDHFAAAGYVLPSN
jgi:predicted nucleic acid-binding protein